MEKQPVVMVRSKHGREREREGGRGGREGERGREM